MMNVLSLSMILIAAAAVAASVCADRAVTRRGLASARNRLIATAKDLVAILALVALALAAIPDSAIVYALGGGNAALSTLAGAGFGSVTIMPAVIAFPLASSLLSKGAGVMAVAAFITTLTMVGIATPPIEATYFGKRFTIIRNVASFGAACCIALFMGAVL